MFFFSFFSICNNGWGNQPKFTYYIEIYFITEVELG